MSDPERLLPLTPAVFAILLALADGDKHGYAIMQEIEAASEGRFRMGPGTLYGSIDRMREGGLASRAVRAAEVANEDPRRRYYRLTPFGRRVLRAETERLASAVRLATAKNVIRPA